MATIRTFIALELNQGIRQRAARLQESLDESGTKVKWTDEDNIHLTLLFLGDVDERDLMSVCRAVQEVAKEHHSFTIRVETLGCFPTIRRPRVVWMGIGEGSEEVCALHDDLEDALLKLGHYRREERKYTPHITLGRVAGRGSADELARLVAEKDDWRGGESVVKEVTVFSSELTSKGPVYSPLSRTKLG